MANKKIIQLEETQNLDNFYIPGSKEVSGELESRKFNLGSIQSSIDEVKSSITSNIDIFSDQVKYYSGQYISYNSKIYRFNTNHFPGEWNNSEVSEVTIYSEVSNLISNSGYETVHFNVSSSDGGLNVEGIQVTLAKSDSSEESITCNSEGNCSINIPIGLEYTIRMNDQPGYQSIGDITYKAEYKNRFVNLVYQKSLEPKTCNVNININIINLFEGGSLSDFEGLTVTLKKASDSSIVGTSNITSGVASFSNIQKGIQYTASLTTPSNYQTLSSSATFTPYDNNTNILFGNYVAKCHDTFGIYLVYTTTTIDENENEIVEYNEILIQDLFTNSDITNGTWRDDLNITLDNAVAFHVYISEYYYSYYVKIEHLTKTNIYVWNSNTSSPYYYIDGIPKLADGNKGNKDYGNGELYTYYLAKGSYNLGFYSNPARWVSNLRFTYKNQNMVGFIGSMYQLNSGLFSTTYRENIYKVLTNLTNNSNLWKYWLGNTANNNFSLCSCQSSGGSNYVLVYKGTAWNSISHLRNSEGNFIPLFSARSML